MEDHTANLHEFELLLDDSRFASSSRVDLGQLRGVCSEGIPAHPPHIRPLSYALLLGTLPLEKKSWKHDGRRRREKYYDLVRALTDDSIPLRSEDDQILAELAKDTHQQGLQHPFLTQASSPRSSRNGLRPPVGPKPRGRAGYQDEESTSSSSGSEVEHDGRVAGPAGEDDLRRDERNVEASEGKVKIGAPGSTQPQGKRKGKSSMQPILSRRRLFDRLREMQIEKDRIRSQIYQSGEGTGPESPAQGTLLAGDQSRDGNEDDRRATASPASGQSPMIVLSASDKEAGPVPAKPSGPRLKGPRLRQPSSKESLLGPGSTAGARSTSPTVQLMEYVDGGAEEQGLEKAITLVESHEIVQSPVDAEKERKDRALSRPDTHAECLLRLMYIFLKTNRGWHYRSDLIEVARVLYTLYASGGDVESFLAQLSERSDPAGQGRIAEQRSSRQRGADLTANGWSRHAEAETYFALVELMNEVGDVFSEGTVGVGRWGEKLAKRVKWADEGLYEILRSKRLSPATTPIYYHWAHTLFSELGTASLVLELWAFILANDEPTRYYNAASEAVLDVATSLLVLIKEELRRDNAYPVKSRSKDLWGSEMAQQVVFDLRDADRPEHRHKSIPSTEAAIVKQYPLEEVGLEEVLRIAREIRQQRLAGEEEGDGPEDVELSDEEEEEGAYIEESKIRSKLQDLAAEAGNNVARQLSYAQARSASLPTPQSLRHSLSIGERLFKQYMATAQDSDAAAQAAKVTTNLSAAALARWNSTNRPANANASEVSTSVPDAHAARSGSGEWGSILTGASKYLNAFRAGSAPSTGPIAGEEFADAANDHSVSPASSRPISPDPAGGANLQRRDTNLPPSFFLSPRGSIVYTRNPYQNKSRGGGRSGARPNLQQRLAAAASNTLAPPPAAPASAGKDRTVRPLLLSASARPASPALSTRSSRSTRSNSITSSGRDSPRSHPSPSDSTTSTDFDRATSRRIPIRRASGEGSTMPVSAFGAAKLKRGGADKNDMSSAAKLRVVTGGGSGSVAEAEPANDEVRQRYALQDAGPLSSRTPEEEQGEDGRYQLFDAPVLSDTSRQAHHESEMISLGDGRSKAVRRPRVQVRPGGLKLRSASGPRSAPGSSHPSTEDLGGLAHRSSLELNMPSPLLEEMSPTTPRAKESGFAGIPDSPGGLKRSHRMAAISATPVKHDDNAELADAPGDTPERLRNQQDGYGDLLANYGNLDI